MSLGLFLNDEGFRASFVSGKDTSELGIGGVFAKGLDTGADSASEVPPVTRELTLRFGVLALGG